MSISDRRLDLSAELHDIMQNVYFKSPSTKNMSYPCVLYSKSGITTIKANNKNYGMFDRYTLTVVDPDPDSIYPKKILSHFPMSEMGTPYQADNLYHYPITLYY